MSAILEIHGITGFDIQFDQREQIIVMEYHEFCTDYKLIMATKHLFLKGFGSNLSNLEKLVAETFTSNPKIKAIYLANCYCQIEEVVVVKNHIQTNYGVEINFSGSDDIVTNIIIRNLTC
jgi:hypothetical protein